MKKRKVLAALLAIAMIWGLSPMQAMAEENEHSIINTTNGDKVITIKYSDVLVREAMEDTHIYTLAADSNISIEVATKYEVYAMVNIFALTDTNENAEIDFDWGVTTVTPQHDFYKAELISSSDEPSRGNLAQNVQEETILFPGDKVHIVMGENSSHSQATQDMLNAGFMTKISLLQDKYYVMAVSFYDINAQFEDYIFFYFTIAGEPAKEQQVEAPIPSSAPATTSTTAIPTVATVLVDDANVAFDAYNIDGNNYFKLRDIAMALNGSAKQFQVGWDASANTISLTGGKAYTAVGGELDSGIAGSQSATPSTSTIYLDGKQVQLTAYTINGNNYFKLRDLGEVFDFGVGWDGASKTISINTKIPYAQQ